MNRDQALTEALSERLTERLVAYANGMRLRGRLADGSWYDVRLHDVTVTVLDLKVDVEWTNERR